MYCKNIPNYQKTTVYNPPEQGPELISKMLNLLITEAKGPTGMRGDLNLILNFMLDCQRSINHKTEKAAVILRRADVEVCLIDIWRTLHPKENDLTYYSRAHKKYSRLDYFFMFKTDVATVINCVTLVLFF